MKPFGQSLLTVESSANSFMPACRCPRDEDVSIVLSLAQTLSQSRGVGPPTQRNAWICERRPRHRGKLDGREIGAAKVQED